MEVEFTDKDGVADTPNSVDYTIHNISEDQEEVKGTTTITPGSSTYEFEITAGENKIYDDDNDEEQRKLTVTADFGSDDKQTETFVWKVVNLEHISS